VLPPANSGDPSIECAIKRNTQLSKLMHSYCVKYGWESHELQFSTRAGEAQGKIVIQGDHTCLSLGIEDGAVISTEALCPVKG